MGAGKAEGSMDAANLLKPLLARGVLHMIGATTLNEYREHIEKDSALERRFQPVCDCGSGWVGGDVGESVWGSVWEYVGVSVYVCRK